MKYKLFTLFLLIFPKFLWAQDAGKYAFTFLEEPVSARMMALGQSGLAIYDNDITLALANPSLINEQMNNDLAFSYVHFFSGVNYGQVQYARNFRRLGSFLFSVQSMNYGTLDYATVNGTQEGTFSAADYAMAMGWGRTLDEHFSIGATARLIGSYYESYSSYGIAVDVAGTYRNDKGFTVSLVASGIGTQIKGFTSGVTAPLPFNLSVAVSQKMAHAPFRFTLVADHLEKWDLTYDSPVILIGRIDPVSGDTIPLSGVAAFSDKLMRHIILGTELYLGKSLSIRLGYNYRRRQELALADRKGLVGFSWGFGVKINRFQIGFARSTYHAGVTPNYFTLTTHLGEFMRRY
ncbi:MAG: type IX secretion system protein PorQ [Bacteroidales bacterium]|nr:type IX secretion system protein PorQ [Bacteroidales bacterium]